MLNLQALVNDLSPSQKSFYLIKEFNRCIETTDISAGVFHIRGSIPPIETLFGCKSVGFLNSYHGTLITTTLQEAEIALNTSNNSNKFLYLWDIEWLQRPMRYTTAINILKDNRLKLIARSTCHAKIISNFCNKPVCGIVDNWKLENLTSVIK